MSDQTPESSDDEAAVTELLESAGGAVDPPAVPVAEDLARGRRRLRRRRVTAGVAALVTVGVVGTGAVLVVGGDDRAPDQVASDPTTSATVTATPTDPATSDPADPPTDDRDAKQLLTDYAVAIADHLDPKREHLDLKPSNLQSGGARGGVSLGTKLGWSVEGDPGLGVIEVDVTSKDGPNAYNYFCDKFTPCQDRTVDGIEARVQHDGDTTTVWAVRDDGSAAMLHVDPLFGNNSLTPVESLEFPVDQLIRAAADPRLTPPTAEQVNCADEAFGWPVIDYDTGKVLKNGKPECR